MWLLLVLLVSGGLGRKLGAQYLFLDPEYLGSVGFWSFFLVGLAFGGFVMTWNLTAYLTTAHYFPFLATLSRPFTKFCLNNILLPLSFLVFYLGYIFFFQRVLEYSSLARVAWLIFGFLGGTGLLVGLYFLYFRLTNRDISHYQGDRDGSGKGMPSGRLGRDLEDIKKNQTRWRVDTYLSESLRPRLVRSVAHYDAALLMRIFRQNHLNALIIQLFGMLLLIGLGSLVEYRIFRIPAGASVLILFSLFTALIGAITYWFGPWKFAFMLFILLALNFLTSFDLLQLRNPAFGLDYDAPRANYTYAHLQELAHPQRRRSDRAQTEAILDRWAVRAAPATGEKPMMVILAVSGGGLKAATWAMKVVQRADAELEGRLMRHTVLIAGASGGMMGMAYFRELYLRQQLGESIDLYDPAYIEQVSRDILNSVAFTLVSNDLFFPLSSFTYNGRRYPKDRGYIFEKQFSENTGGLLDKPLGYYRQPEQEALVPMCYITPSIINDGRRLLISPLPLSFMMAPPDPYAPNPVFEIDAVDFRSLFEDQAADDLRFLTALRMNATFPYILPSVTLPSRPAIEVMDSGYRDNYGLLSAIRFLQVFQDWVQENTRGVILLQVSSSNRIEQISASDNKGVVESLFNPFGIPGQLIELQEYEQDNSLGLMIELFGPDRFHLLRFQFRPEASGNLRAGISFHITERERANIVGAMNEPANVSSLRQLKALLNP